MNCINSISDTPERQDPTRYTDVIHWHVNSQDRNSKIFLAQWEKHKMMKKKYKFENYLNSSLQSVGASRSDLQQKKLYPRRLTRPTEETKPIILEGELFKAIKDLLMIVNFPFYRIRDKSVTIYPSEYHNILREDMVYDSKRRKGVMGRREYCRANNRMFQNTLITNIAFLLK